MMSTGERIRNTREDLDILQQELADAVGINVSVLSRIEKGTRAIRDDELAKIANKLHVSSDYLLELSDTAHPPATSPSAPVLTSQDQELLYKYHTLTDEHKGLLNTQLDAMYSLDKPKVEDTAT